MAGRRRPLSKAHKQKISRALKGRGNGRKPPTLQGHVVKGAKIGAAITGGAGAIGGALLGGAIAGPVGAAAGGIGYGGLYGASGAISGAGYGAAIYGGRRLLSRRQAEAVKNKKTRRYSSASRSSSFMLSDFDDDAQFKKSGWDKREKAAAMAMANKGRFGFKNEAVGYSKDKEDNVYARSVYKGPLGVRAYGRKGYKLGRTERKILNKKLKAYKMQQARKTKI